MSKKAIKLFVNEGLYEIPDINYDYPYYGKGITKLMKWCVLAKKYPELIDEIKKLDKEELDKQDDFGWSALRYAISNNNYEVVKILLENGANPNLQDNYDGITELIYIVNGCNKPDFVKLLLEYGANPFIQNNYGINAIMDNCNYCKTVTITDYDYKKKDIAKMLLDYGANHNIKDNIDVKDNKGYTALTYASKNGHHMIVELLLEYGANLDITDDKGKTALIYASSIGYDEIVKLLILHGASINIMDNKERTAIDLAQTDSIKQILLESQHKVKSAKIE